MKILYDICEKADQQQTERIKTIDSTTVSISMRDFIVKENDIEFDFNSSSLACARVCGYFCDVLGNMPLNDKFKLLAKEYNINLYDSENSKCAEFKESDIHELLVNNKVAVVLFPSKSLESIKKEYLHENIVAYYDHDKSDFYSFKDGSLTKDFDVIIILNSSYVDMEVPQNIKEKYKEYKVICLGNFLNISDKNYLHYYEEYRYFELSVLEKPVIAIVGMCSGLNKSDTQLSLLSSLKDDGLDIEAFEYLKENIEEKVFTLDQVRDGILYANIIEALS